MGDNKSGKRIIAIAVSPKAYDEILTLKGDRTWTKWLLELMLLQNATNEILNTEMDRLVMPKAEKLETEKPEEKKSKAERKPKKVKAEAKTEPEREVEFGVPNQKTGGTPVDVTKIGTYETEPETSEVQGEESGDLVLEK